MFIEHYLAIIGERSQLQETTFCMTPFIRNVQNRQMYGDTDETVVANGWKCCGRWGITANKHGISFGSDKSVLE